MDSVIMAIEPLKDFTKDSVRLVNRCTKPDRKGMFVCNHRLEMSAQMIVPASTLHNTLILAIYTLFRCLVLKIRRYAGFSIFKKSAIKILVYLYTQTKLR